MFTGIVRELGRVVSAEKDGEGLALVIDAPETVGALAVGDSISIDGVCLTAETVTNGRVSLHAVPESLARSTLGSLAAGDRVNVEPALRAGEPLGGHYVQGHVDAVARVRSVERAGTEVRVAFEAPPETLRYLVEKGSVTVAGVALTVAELSTDSFTVALVPHTLAVTTLATLEAAQQVNLEVDVLAKYVERLLQ
jgi:riboflavin synthase alpha subunit